LTFVYCAFKMIQLKRYIIIIIIIIIIRPITAVWSADSRLT